MSYILCNNYLFSVIAGFSTSSGSRIIYNTGYTTFVNRGHPLIMEERILVTGHELGHNWGSNHDPATDPECSDMYIMNEYAQDGSQPTHTVKNKL